MVALTSMLVTYTLYQSISGYLPQTSYMKMIDIWLFGGLFFPFIIITILIIMDSLITKEKNPVIGTKKGSRLNSKSFMKWMKVSLFAVGGIFCAIYWSYGMYHFYFDCSMWTYLPTHLFSICSTFNCLLHLYTHYHFYHFYLWQINSKGRARTKKIQDQRIFQF